MLNEIEKPQVWRKTRQAHALQEKTVAATDVSLFLELEEELALFGKIRIFSYGVATRATRHYFHK